MTKKKKTFTILGVSIALLSIIGISYAYWFLTHTQVGENKLATSCLSLSITNEKNDINLQKAYPISDEEGKNLIPYSFTITNTCDMFTSYTVSLEMLKDSTMSSEFLKTMINKEEVHNLSTLETTDVVNTDSIESRILANGSLGSGDSVDYTLRVWMDGDSTSTESMNKDFIGKVVVTAKMSTYSPVEQGITKLSEAILANEYQTSVEAAKEKINNKQAANFTKTAPIIDWQESHANTATTKEATMPHPDLVGEYGVTSIEQTQVKLGKGYTFNKETARYNLTDTVMADPTTINYNDGNNYYFCSAGVNITSSGILEAYQNFQNCTTIYKVIGASKADNIKTNTTGDSFKVIKYTLEGYQYTQIELESDKSEKGLYKGLDDYGDTYYYRGSVQNNYVKFNDIYWRIIRINGDGSTRLFYAGTTLNATEKNLKIGNSAFNTEKNIPGYVGYMYGNAEGATIDEIYVNTNNSTMKEYLENWYKTNILDNGLSSLIADAGFCNDRSIVSGDGVSLNNYTNFGPTDRWNKNAPSLVCPNKERDLFTTSTATVGNKASRYPIGLITTDELVYAGMANGYLNKLSYIYSSEWYWTMSPSAYSPVISTSDEFGLSNDGILRTWGTATSSGAVRPVINLKSNVEITGGIGTSNDPFVIKTT